jgi:ABC-type Fe3+/spermidine/putrescine transport system ATPase subunit/ABC-type spermidine/putrescine transport system permease subunit II
MGELLLGTIGRRSLIGYGWVLMFFIVAPALALVPVSLGGDEAFVLIPHHFSLYWYRNLFTDDGWRDALFLSLRLAAFAAVVATSAGVLAAIGISRMPASLAKPLRFLFVSPMIVPLMIIGVGLYVFYARLHLLGGFFSLGVAHAALVLPFVILPVSARLLSIDGRLEWAAASLGAGTYRTILRVILPLLTTAIAAGAAFAFIFSFDEVVVAQFLSGPSLETLPRRMWEGITMGGLDKTITAVTSVQLGLALLATAGLTVWRWTSARRHRAVTVATPGVLTLPSNRNETEDVPAWKRNRGDSHRSLDLGQAGEQGVGIEFEGLTKQYNTNVAVDGLNLSVAPGEFLSILGPSGSGKTTVLMLVAGFVSPSAGHLRLGGQDISTIPPHQRDIGVVFQNYALFPHLDVRRNVAFPLEVRGISADKIRRRVEWALARVHMQDFAERRISQLSGGQQQRVALARAIVFHPRALLMDEPLAALDRNLRVNMQDEIRTLTRSLGQTVIYVTHDQEEALNLSDRVAVMHRGRLQQVSSPRDLYLHPTNPFVASFFGEANLFAGNANGMTLDTDNGIRLPLGTRREGRSILCVRPELVMLDAPERGDFPRLEGRITETRYQGAVLRTRVQTALGAVTVLRHTNTATAAPSEGAVVTLSWDQNLTHVMPSDNVEAVEATT